MPGQTTPAGLALALLELHQPGNPVILPTVWDAWSAHLATDAGFAALTVGSHPLADSIGKPDNEGMSFEDVLNRVAQITAAVDVPVSVDIESGYGLSAARLVEGLLSVGAVGLNIEDTVHSEGKRLRSAREHAELVGALRSAADEIVKFGEFSSGGGQRDLLEDGGMDHNTPPDTIHCADPM